jgi:cell division septum initiation protein DivIVA
MAPEEIRDAALPRGLRGFDEAATRSLLEAAADTVHALIAERDRLRRQLDQMPASPSPDDPTAIGNALLAAQRAGEELVAQAREAAERITADGRAERERLLEHARKSAGELDRRLDERRQELDQGHMRLRKETEELKAKVEEERKAAIAKVRAEGDQLAALAHQRVEALRREEEALRKVIGERRNQFVAVLQATLDQVNRLPEPTAGGNANPELAQVLTSRAGDVRGTGERPSADERRPELPAHNLRLSEAGDSTLGEPSDGGSPAA